MSEKTDEKLRVIRRARHTSDKRERRATLLDAAARLFAERDFNSVAMADVASATGLVARGRPP